MRGVRHGKLHLLPVDILQEHIPDSVPHLHRNPINALQSSTQLADMQTG
jgi:hypothetical protein